MSTLPLTQEGFEREAHEVTFARPDRSRCAFDKIATSHAALLARVSELEERFARMIEHRALVLQHVGHIGFDNATVVRDTEGNPIAAFWSPQNAANYVDLQTADESVGRLTNERDSARLECVGLKQRIAALEAAQRWIPVKDRHPVTGENTGETDGKD